LRITIKSYYNQLIAGAREFVKNKIDKKLAQGVKYLKFILVTEYECD